MKWNDCQAHIDSDITNLQSQSYEIMNKFSEEVQWHLQTFGRYIGQRDQRLHTLLCE